MGFKEEFQLKNFGLSHHPREELQIAWTNSIPPGMLLLIRFMLSIYLIVFMSISIANYTGPYLAYLTSWNYLLVLLYFVLAFFATLSHVMLYKGSHFFSKSPASTQEKGSTAELLMEDGRSGERSTTSGVDILLKILWAVYNYTLNSSIVLTLVYWAAIHDYDKDKHRTVLQMYLVIDRHAVVSLFTIIDFAFNAIPFRLLHVIYPVGLALIYGVFNIIYWRASGKILYKAYDWENSPGKAIGFFFLTVFIVIIAHFVMYGLYLFKRRVIGRDYQPIR